MVSYPEGDDTNTVEFEGLDLQSTVAEFLSEFQSRFNLNGKLFAFYFKGNLLTDEAIIGDSSISEGDLIALKQFHMPA